MAVSGADDAIGESFVSPPMRVEEETVADAELAIYLVDSTPAASTRAPYSGAASRSQKPSPGEVIVIALGSHSIRYGLASDDGPRKIRAVAALARTPPGGGVVVARKAAEGGDWARFDEIVGEISEEKELGSRRRGRGKPIPWEVEIECVDVEDVHENLEGMDDGQGALVGRKAEKVLYGPEEGRKHFDVVAPICDGRMAWNDSCAESTVRSALDALFRYIGNEMHQRKGRANGGSAAKEEGTGSGDFLTHIVLIVPESSDRADVAEFVSALHRVEELRMAAVFIHHNSVSCALGAGLSTCVVVDVGHSATTISCVEEGCIIADSRIHMHYGSQLIASAFERLLRRSGAFDELSRDMTPDDGRLLISRACEQLCTFSSDENDTLSIVMARAPECGKMFRVKCGIGVRAIPAYGLLKPKLLAAAAGALGLPKGRLRKPAMDRNSIEDNFMEGLFDDIKRSATVLAAIQFGLFANECLDVLQDESSPRHPTSAPLPDAIVWAVTRAIAASILSQTDAQHNILRRRYFNSILLAGGASALDGIGLALEGRIKKSLSGLGIDVSDVTVIDGAKAKSDEELLAAGVAGKLDDDNDPACLPWKGGAVMVEADAVREGWVYRDEWEARGVRALRERVPFYW